MGQRKIYGVIRKITQVLCCNAVFAVTTRVPIAESFISVSFYKSLFSERAFIQRLALS